MHSADASGPWIVLFCFGDVSHERDARHSRFTVKTEETQRLRVKFVLCRSEFSTLKIEQTHFGRKQDCQTLNAHSHASESAGCEMRRQKKLSVFNILSSTNIFSNPMNLAVEYVRRLNEREEMMNSEDDKILRRGIVTEQRANEEVITR